MTIPDLALFPPLPSCPFALLLSRGNHAVCLRCWIPCHHYLKKRRAITWHSASEKGRGIQSGSRVGGNLIMTMEDLRQNPSTEATSCGRFAKLIRRRT